MTTYTTDDQYPEGGNYKPGDICECTNPALPVKSWVYSGREWVPNHLYSWVGTQAQYDAIAVKDANTQYNTDVGIYVGNALVSPGAGSSIPSVAASRGLTKADCVQPLRCESASSIVLTINNDATVGYSGTEAHVAYQAGAGAVSFTAGSGVTLRGTPPTAAQYATQGVMRVGSNEWAYL